MDPLSSNVLSSGSAKPRPARGQTSLASRSAASRALLPPGWWLGSGNFSSRTGAGYVAYKKPDYAHALSRSDTNLLMLLFETYGGQYENEVSWSTSTWLALQAQRLSVAVHIASAWEIATEMQLAGGGGEAPSSDEEPGRRHGVSPHRTLSGQVVCLFVFVRVCVCTLE